MYEKRFSFEKSYGVPNGVLIGIAIGGGRKPALLKLTQGPVVSISFTGHDADEKYMDITDVSEALVTHRTGRNTCPDRVRKSRGILNALEINYVDEDKYINCCPFLAHSCNPS